MAKTAVDPHRALAVMGDLRSELTERFLTESWHDLSLHVFPTGRAALRANLRQPVCLWFVPEALPDISGLEFIQLISEIRLADRFILIAQHYDDDSDRRASCLARTTYCVWPLAPPFFQQLMESFLAALPSDRAPQELSSPKPQSRSAKGSTESHSSKGERS